MSEDIFIIKNYLKCMEFAIKHQMYFEINYEQTKEFYNSIYKLLKEIEELQTKLEIEKIDNKYNQEERDEETIPRCKIREKIKEIKNKNEENKIELAKGIDTLNFDIIENAKNNILINVNVRDILKELLEDK